MYGWGGLGTLCACHFVVSGETHPCVMEMTRIILIHGQAHFTSLKGLMQKSGVSWEVYQVRDTGMWSWGWCLTQRYDEHWNRETYWLWKDGDPSHRGQERRFEVVTGMGDDIASSTPPTPCSPSPFILTFFEFLRCIKFCPTSGHLHLLFLFT